MTDPDTENANAYYHALALRLNELPIPHLAMPNFLVPKSEIEYLNYVLPQGHRIFRGAMEGIAQAQYELAVLYQNDRFFPPDHKQMLYWYNQAAKNGLAEAMWQMTVLSLLDKDLIQAKKWLARLSQHAGMFGYMSKAVSYLLDENALSIRNVIGCMRGFQSRG
jgi:TPR repeat protein